MSTTSTTPTRKKRRPSRWALLSIIALLVGAGFVVTGVGGTPAAQAGFLGICDADTTFPTPSDPGGTTTGITYSSVTSTPTANAGSENVDPKTYTVVIPSYGQKTPLQQYAGGGLHWYPFAMSCMDAQPQIQGVIANWVFEVVALWPMRILGILMQFSFSTTISDALLGAASAIVSSLSTNVWTTWSPLIIMLVLSGAMIKVARGRGREGYGALVWALLCGVIVTSALTTDGLNIVKKINNEVRDLTSCITFSMTGAGCADGGSALYADAMVESLAANVWASGALGDLAHKTPYETNGSWNLTIKHHEGTPDLDDNATVHLITSAIPAKVAGSPTWAEVMRWTQTYTNAEVVAMQEDGALQCKKSPDQSPKTWELTNLDDSDEWNPGQLCTYKWLVRAAIVSELYHEKPQAYATFRGVTQEMTTAAVGAVGLLPLGIGIGSMGFMVFLYQVELVALFVVTPIVGLISLKNPRAIRRWGEMMFATLVRRLAVGFTLGLVIWLASTANVWFTGTVSGPMGVTVMSPKAIAIATSALTIGCMIVGWMLLKRVQAMFLEGLELPTQPGMADGAMDKAKQGGKKALEIGVSASAGALAAGSGMRMKGAMRGMTRSNAFGGSMGRAFRAGDHAGFYIHNQKDREEAAAEKEQQQQQRDANAAATSAARAQKQTTTATTNLDSARAAFKTTPQFRPAGWEEAERIFNAAGTNKIDQELRVRQAQAGRDEWVTTRAGQIVTAEQVDPAAAHQRASAQWDAQMNTEIENLRRFDAVLKEATTAMDALKGEAAAKADMVVERMRGGAALEEAAAEFGLNAQTKADLAKFAAASQAYTDALGLYPPES